jgi:hypothetical protein
MKGICNGQEDTEVAPCNGMPVTTDYMYVKHVHAVIKENCSTMCKAITADFGISSKNVFHILNNHLCKRQVCAKWIPQMLTEDQRAVSIMCPLHISNNRRGG